PDLRGPRRPKSYLLDQPRPLRDQAHTVGRESVERELVRQVNLGIGNLDQGENLVGAVLLEEKIIERRVAHFPGVHEQALDLLRGEIEPVLPEIAVLEIAVFARLDVIRMSRE